MTKIVYQTDASGLLVDAISLGDGDRDPLCPDTWLIPAGCTDLAPPVVVASQCARLVDGAWTVEDIPAPGPAPIAPPPDRRVEIMAQMAVIDAASARPMRAIVGGSAAPADHDRLAELETQAAGLRAELAALPTTP